MAFARRSTIPRRAPRALPGGRSDVPYLDIYPPIFNSASPWATTKDQIGALLRNPCTGAVTTRTSMLGGFNHDPSKHRVAFIDPQTGRNDSTNGKTYSLPDIQQGTMSFASNLLPSELSEDWTSSLNNLGYSPFSLQDYLHILRELGQQVSEDERTKTVIISVTGAERELSRCYELIVQAIPTISFKLAMEVNLSCPNIEDQSPVAYDHDKLASYLRALPTSPRIPVGVKFPPYTFKEQFFMVKKVLLEVEAHLRISFITAVNTLGCCAVANTGDDSGVLALPGDGVGGLAGTAIHPLALGNVKLHGEIVIDGPLSGIEIIGVGGVRDGQGYKNMRTVGASFVALATAMGEESMVFSDIDRHIDGEWDGYDSPKF